MDQYMENRIDKWNLKASVKIGQHVYESMTAGDVYIYINIYTYTYIPYI